MIADTLRVFLTPLRALAWLALLVAAVSPASAATVSLATMERPTDVTRGWVYQPGDDPAWAAPGFDDSKWEEVNLDEVWQPTNHTRFAGFSWYRLRVQLPQGYDARRVPLGALPGL